MTTGIAPRSAAAPASGRRAVGLWLVVCCAMVFLMVVLGGATRLTESGLSMVEWRPVTGWLPPLSDAAWQASFDAYRRSPEFQKMNFWMSLADYKAIFWLEYIHRLWGRLIGVVFLLPFLWFALRRRIDGRLGWQLAGLFVLGGLQGGLGWYMVASGLVDRPDVSQYRLAAHLGVAVAIYGWMLWLALGCLAPRRRAAGPRPLGGAVWLLIGWVGLTLVAGAFVAGMDAGFIYNTYPLMGDRLVPESAFEMAPWWINFFENAALVQFVHRLLGTALPFIALGFWLAARRAAITDRAWRAAGWMALAAVLQMALGIATLLAHVPVPLGVAHQAGAQVVLGLALWTAYELRGDRRF
jgi:cytochrome c oxidase assembly protein subunit 15